MATKKAVIKAIKDIAYLEGDFTTRAGKKTSYYIDKYRFETNPKTLEQVCDELVKLLPEPSTYDKLAGPELGAVSLVAVLSIKVNKPFIIVRKESKGYGTSNLIEGPYSKDDRCVLIEDVLTTGGAVLKAAEALQAQNLTISKIIGVINREEGAIQNIQEKGFEVDALVTTSDLKSC